MDRMQESRTVVHRLFYLGFAFPPGLAELYPGINPAGHGLETRMVSELRRHLEIRSAGILPFDPPPSEAYRGLSAPGIDHEILLVEKPPELMHRLRSLNRLKAEYSRWQAGGWQADAVLVYNLSPIYNAFLLWLRQQPERPFLVLLLLDSPNLGQKLSWFKRFRRRLKPFYVPDSDMVLRFDACAGLSQSTEKYFTARSIPFLWIPGGCNPSRALSNVEVGERVDSNGPIRFGYFGALGPYAGAKKLADVFLNRNIPGTLNICGHGNNAEEFAHLAASNPAVRFHGLLTPDDSLKFGRACDVLVNPRPITHGNENNFASKLFDYALTGRAILTSRLSGVESVLGPEAYYFEPQNFDENLAQALGELATTPRKELNRRGVAVQQRVVADYSWENQGARLAAFIKAAGSKNDLKPCSGVS